MIQYYFIQEDGKRLLVFWIPAMQEGRLLAMSERKSIVKGLRAIEKRIATMNASEKLLDGWASWTEHNRDDIKGFFKKFGAVRLKEINGNVWFFKEIE